MRQKCFKNNVSIWIPETKNKLQTDVQKIKKRGTTFQQALRRTIAIGQLFSLLPVIGIFSDNASNVKYVKISWRSFYSLLSLIGQIFMLFSCLNSLVKSTVTLNGTASIIFYATVCVSMVLFFKTAGRWPELVRHITKFEDIRPCIDINLNKKCNITCAILLALALVEHIFYILLKIATGCSTQKITYQRFLIHMYPWIFNYIPYKPLIGIVVQFFHVQATFTWNFLDIFVICMSYYLISRLEQVNKKVLEAQGKYLPALFWRAAREDYCRATQIVQKVDDVISGIVFISFANNLFYVCLQLYNMIEEGLKRDADICSLKVTNRLLGGHEASVYYLFSLVYLLLRSIIVSLVASQVNRASLVPAPVLYEVPSSVYCLEVQRFLDQVKGDKVALTGLQFFSVTRGLLLTMAGTIVTYELVMVQFKSPTLTTSTTSLLAPNVTPTTTANFTL